MRNSINKWAVMIALAVFLTISVGYALFSDTITIEGTATAQGNFNVDATCQTGSPSDIVDESYIEIDDEVGYKNDICTVSDDKVTFSVDLQYPGARRYYTIKYTNNGTVAAKLDGPSALDYKTYLECVDGLNGEANGKIEEESECYSEEKIFFQGMVPGVAFEDKDGNIISMNEENEDFIFNKYVVFEGDGGYYVLQPGESMYLRGEVWLEIKNEESLLNNNFLTKSVVTYEHNFEQLTN